MAYLLHNRNKVWSAAPDESLDSILDRSIGPAGLDGGIMIIVPTGRRVRLVAREITDTVAARCGKPVENPPVFTLEKFIRECARRCIARPPRIVSEAYQRALMEEAAAKARLKFYKGRQDSLAPAALERLSNVILGLKEDGVSPQSLQEDIQRALAGDDLYMDVARLNDVLELYRAYEAILGRELCDFPRLLEWTTEIIGGQRNGQSLEKIAIPAALPGDIHQRWAALFPELQALVIDGFSEFKVPEVNFLAHLAHAPFHTRIHLDFSESNGPLFANLQETLDNLKSAGFEAVALDPLFDDEGMAGANGRLAPYLRRWLFNTEEDRHQPGFENCIRILGAQDRVDEVRSIARLIKHYALHENIRPADMCVVMRRPELYSELFREIFVAYDIPINVSDRFLMAKSPVSIAVFAVLDIVLHGFRRQDIHRALQSPYVRFSRADKGRTHKLDAANLYTVAGRLRIGGGHRRGAAYGWISRMEKRLQYLAARRAQLQAEAFPDPDEIREVEREHRETALALADFTALREALPAVERNLRPAQFAQIIKTEVLQRLQVRESILEFHQQSRNAGGLSAVQRMELREEVEKDARSFTAFVAMLDELAAIYEERYPGRERPFREYAERLRTAATAQRYQIREKTGYGVTVTAIEQIRNIPFALTVICGAVDGEFPGMYVPESFLGKDLPDTEDRFLKAERMLYYQALTNAPRLLEEGRKNIFITYPMYREDQEVVRSPFIDALLKITVLEGAGRVYELPAVRRVLAGPGADSVALRRQLPWVDAAAGAEELLQQIGVLAAARACDKESGLPAGAESLMQHLDAPRKGEARRIVRAIERERKAPPGFGRVELRPDNLTPAAGELLRAMAARPYSVTALETYAKCPYRFFSARLLGLEEPEEYDTLLSPLERGSFLHRILFRFYRSIQEEQVRTGESMNIPALQEGLPPLVPVWLDPAQAERYHRLLLDIAREESEHIRYEHPFFALEREELLGAEGRAGKLEIWLREELVRVESGWGFQPALFEFGFGSQSARPDMRGIPPLQLGAGLQLIGKIDRIEIDTAPVEDGHTADYTIMVGDYKSGRADRQDTNTDIARGVALQMPLYIAAAQDILRRYYGMETQPLGAVYYTLTPVAGKRAGGGIETHSFVLLPKDAPLGAAIKSRRSQVVESAAEAGRMVAAAVEHAAGIVAGIAAGSFPVRPFDTQKACAYCRFGPVCRIREAAS